MIIPPINEMTLYNVEGRGLPNLERIPIYVNQTIDTVNFGVLLGQAIGSEGNVVPILDHFFWFGEAILNAGDWIFLHTGQGSPRVDDWRERPGSKIYSLHWGKANTIFANSSIVPVLFKIDSLLIGTQPQNLPQLNLTGK